MERHTSAAFRTEAVTSSRLARPLARPSAALYVAASFDPFESAVLARGVQWRAIYTVSSFDQGATWDEVGALAEQGEQSRITDDLPIKLYEGEPGDIVFLTSLLDSEQIEVVTAGAFFGAAREVYVRRRDEAAAREILADFESHRQRGGNILPGPWPK